ncbi:Hypothetical predicted protein [Paramuricea clavata]|uniref:Mutator-like transposase domain-containing protein n=1 Tax=Paramuricea clavata TaxID=317549 RepID=A0A7D9HI03_PARCT|nr:Hypothetical predicted protein [Paramuricea clavata]
MAGGKKKNCYRKTRKGKPFPGVQRYSKFIDQRIEEAAGTSQAVRNDGENEPACVSSSRKTMQIQHDAEQQADASSDFEQDEYLLINVVLLLKEKSAQRYGLKSEISVSCNSCHKETSLVTSGSVAERGTSYDVNRRAVYHSIETGSGYEGLASFCSIMNMPCISKPAYQQQIKTILLSLEEEANEQMKNAGKELHELMISNETADVVDIAVSFDGTWAKSAKRGFTSLAGVVFVISVDTGKVLDYHCLSKACQKCSLKKSKCKDDAQFQEWQVEQLASGDCDINFDGSSPAMECEGAVTFDGGSKAHAAVEDVYGGQCKVEKLDCVGHVQKRMGKHLMKLKASNKSKLSDGKTIGGKGRLTEGKIKQLQKYYGLAIRQNTSKKPNPTQAEI